MRVLIRADASYAIGSGHVARCLTLAQVLRLRGADVSFACRELPGNALGHISAAGFAIVLLPAQYPDDPPLDRIEDLIAWQSDSAALQNALAGQAVFDWLLLDHYGLDARWQHAVRPLAKRIAVIDDLANRPHDADLLLDQNLTASAVAYQGLLPAACQTLYGPQYALLRPEFAGEPIAIKPVAQRILVSFGGVDLGGETFKAMDALEGMDDVQVDFVAGAANPAWEALQTRVAKHGNWQLHRHVQDFAALMREADLFIGAGGGTSWERAALGLPTICIAVAANQEPNARKLAEAGAHHYLGPAASVSTEKLQSAIKLLREHADKRLTLANLSRQLVDGKGTRRMASAIQSATVQLRPATGADAKLLFDGRNAEPVRRWSLTTEPIVWESHLAWLQAVLQRQDRCLLVAESAGEPLGVLRYDRNSEYPHRAEVSIYLLPGKDGKGWGSVLLDLGDRYIETRWSGLNTIDATVKPENHASVSLFAQAGYRQRGAHFERVLSKSQEGKA